MSEDIKHNDKVEWLKGLLRKMGVPTDRPHLVFCDSYHPDACARLGEKITVFEYINSEGQFNFDIGGLTALLLHKDIIDVCVAVVNDKVFPGLVEKIRKFRNPFLERLIILRENEIEDWLRERISDSPLWKVEDLEVID